MALCVIVDSANDRVLAFCGGDAERDGVAEPCTASGGCHSALAGQTRRFYSGTRDAFITAMIADSTTCTAWHEMDGSSYDGTDFGELALLPRS